MFGNFAFRDLIKCDWFTLNVKEWIWISEKEGDKDLIAKAKLEIWVFGNEICSKSNQF